MCQNAGNDIRRPIVMPQSDEGKLSKTFFSNKKTNFYKKKHFLEMERKLLLKLLNYLQKMVIQIYIHVNIIIMILYT